MDEAVKRQAIRSAWCVEDPPVVPFMIEVGESHYARMDYLEDISADLAAQEARWDTLAALDDFAIPSLKPNLGIGILAAAFGCEWVPDRSRDPWVKPLIGDHNVDAVYRLMPPDPARSAQYALAAARIAYLQQHGHAPLRLVNVPSPLVTASLIWEYSSFLSSIVLNPKAVHALLDVVTAATIQFVTWQLQVIENLYALTHEPWYLPVDLGIRISDDTAATLSPAAYRQFGLPYNARLAEAFHGLVIHSCGNIGHVLPVMMETPGLRGIDLVVAQNDWSRISEVVRGRVGLCLRYFGWDFPAGHPSDMLAYSQALLEHFGRRGVMLWTQVGTLAEARQLSAGLWRVVPS